MLAGNVDLEISAGGRVSRVTLIITLLFVLDPISHRPTKESTSALKMKHKRVSVCTRLRGWISFGSVKVPTVFISTIPEGDL